MPRSQSSLSARRTLALRNPRSIRSSDGSWLRDLPQTSTKSCVARKGDAIKVRKPISLQVIRLVQQRKRPGGREAFTFTLPEKVRHKVPRSQALARFLEALSPIYMSHPCPTLMTLNGFMLVGAALGWAEHCCWRFMKAAGPVTSDETFYFECCS